MKAVEAGAGDVVSVGRVSASMSEDLSASGQGSSSAVSTNYVRQIVAAEAEGAGDDVVQSCQLFNASHPEKDSQLFSEGLGHLKVRFGTQADSLASVAEAAGILTRVALPQQLLQDPRAVKLLQDCTKMEELTVSFDGRRPLPGTTMTLAQAQFAATCIKLKGQADTEGIGELLVGACRDLRILDLTNWKNGTRDDLEGLLRRAKGIERLVLRGMPCVRDDVLADLGKGRRVFPQLTELDLSHLPEEFDGKGLKQWIRKAPTLRLLNLFNSRGVTDTYVADAIGCSRSLQKVFLNNCLYVGDASVKALGQCAELTDVNLNGTAVTDAGLTALRGLRALGTVYVRHCGGVTEKGIVSLLEHNPSLHHVDVTGCSIDKDALETLKGHFDRVTIVDAAFTSGSGSSSSSASHRGGSLS